MKKKINNFNFRKRIFASLVIFALLVSHFPVLGLGAGQVFAAESGYVAPDTSNTANISNSGWLNPQYVVLSNNYRAEADSSNDVVSYRGFSFNIPQGATISGIEIKIEGYTTGTRQAEISLSWNNGSNYTVGSGTGVKVTNLPVCSDGTCENLQSLGGSNDKWGRANWDVNDLTPQNLRVKLDATTGYGSRLYINQLSVKIYYNENQAPSTPLLVAPISGEYVGTGTPLLDWQDATDPEGHSISYVIQVDDSDLFDAPIAEVTTPFSSYQIPISTALSEGAYYWRVRAEDEYGSSSSWSSVSIFTVDVTNPVITNQNVSNFVLSPNGDSVLDETVISYDLSENAFVTIKVYDELDNLVRTLLSDGEKYAGSNSDVWDGKDDSLTVLPDGYYLVEISARDYAGNVSVLNKYIYDICVDTKAPQIADMANIRTNEPVYLEGYATDENTEINYKWKQVDGPTGGMVHFENDIDPATEAYADVDGIYVLRLTATDLAGNSSSKEIVFEWDTRVSAVSDITAMVDGNKIKIKWTNPDDPDFVGTEIYRSTVKDELGNLLTVLSKDENYYEDTTAIVGVNYYYTIISLDDLDNWSKSDQANAIVPFIDSSVALTPIMVSANARSVFDSGEPSVSEDSQKEVKSEVSQEEEKSNQDEDSSMPAFGIFILLLLIIVGLYLIYIQKPEWFQWLLFWKRKRNSKK